MGYVDAQLLPGENIVYRSKLHWQIFLLPGFIAFFALTMSISGGWLFLVVAGLIILAPYISRVNSEFAVTNKRIIIKVGLFTTRTIELMLSKVETISVNQGMLGKMLNYGSITVVGSGGTREVFSSIESPLEFRRAVQAATTSAA